MAAPDPAVTLDSGTLSILTGSMNRAALVEAAGVGHYAENVRYDYLDTKNQPTKNQATADRTEAESGSGAARRLDYSTPAVGSPNK